MNQEYIPLPWPEFQTSRIILHKKHEAKLEGIIQGTAQSGAWIFHKELSRCALAFFREQSAKRIPQNFPMCLFILAIVA